MNPSDSPVPPKGQETLNTAARRFRLSEMTLADMDALTRKIAAEVDGPEPPPNYIHRAAAAYKEHASRLVGMPTLAQFVAPGDLVYCPPRGLNYELSDDIATTQRPRSWYYVAASEWHHTRAQWLIAYHGLWPCRWHDPNELFLRVKRVFARSLTHQCTFGPTSAGGVRSIACAEHGEWGRLAAR